MRYDLCANFVHTQCSRLVIIPQILYFFLVSTSRVSFSSATRSSHSGNDCNASNAFELYSVAKSLVFVKPSEAATNSRA